MSASGSQASQLEVFLVSSGVFAIVKAQFSTRIIGVFVDETKPPILSTPLEYY